MWTRLMPAAIALRRSSSAVPEPPCRVSGIRAALLICAIRAMSRCLRVSPLAYGRVVLLCLRQGFSQGEHAASPFSGMTGPG
jgi:hypothetical protein